jgi:neutral ceramidase
MRIAVTMAVTFSTIFALQARADRIDNPMGWRALFNGKNLDGWYTFLQEHGKDSDPDQIIAIEDGVIHCYKDAPHGSKVVMGYIATNDEFENYHLRFEFKWGEKQFQPRLELKPDAGLYYHMCGPDAVWPKSIQYQIQKGDVGDLLALYGVQVDTWIDPATENEKERTFLDAADNGKPVALGGEGIGYQHKRGMFELEGWNTVELIVNGRTSMHILNGKLVNRCENIRQRDPANPGPPVALTKGRISLELEATEISYRNIEIRPLHQEPAANAATESGLSVGAAAVNLPADDSMVNAGGIGPWKPTGQEGELRATAVVVSKPPAEPIVLVGCDVLFVSRDMVDAALAEIEKTTGIPPDHVLINASHTHSAPSVTRIHGYDVEPKFKETLQKGIVQAVQLAHARLEPNCEFDFAQGFEYSVGENSRLRLSDNTIFWTGSMDDAVGPSDPFDPELPIFAFRNEHGGLETLFFNHSTHTIGTVHGMVRSPSYYGLAAQELELETGAVVGFLEGASGSTHNLRISNMRIAVDRIKYSVLTTLGKSSRMPVNRLTAIRRPLKYKVRAFDEAVEEKKVVDYCTKRIPQGADGVIEVFRTMRRELAPHQGEERETYVQAIRIGNVAIVGVPAEYFTVLGIEIKKRSPFEYTYVAELANDWIGYLPDRKGHEMGGYQTWMGYHCLAEIGTGERIVDEAVSILNELAR